MSSEIGEDRGVPRTPLDRAPTIRDVAAVAGVSRAAVSKVLRDAYGVSPAMRTRVTAAMAELNYRPRVAARAMRGRTFTIGVELPDISNQFFTRILHGAIDALSDTPYQVVVAPAEEGSRRGLKAIEALVDRQVDGVIAVAPPIGARGIEPIAASTPVVMFGRHDPAESHDSITADDLRGATLAIDHLLALGHERIAHLTLLDITEAEESPHGHRLRTYGRAMRARDAYDDALILRSDDGQDVAYAAVRDALAAGLDATALFAAHDELAIGALRAITEAGVSLAVVGYDDVPIASHPALGLTSVHQPGEAMGARAAELLLERIAGRTEARHEVFTPELRVRTSTFPPT